MTAKHYVALTIVVLLLIGGMLAAFFTLTSIVKFTQTLDRDVLFVTVACSCTLVFASLLVASGIRGAGRLVADSRTRQHRVATCSKLLRAVSDVTSRNHSDFGEIECAFLMIASASTVNAYKSHREGPTQKSLNALLKAMRKDLGVSSTQMDEELTIASRGKAG